MLVAPSRLAVTVRALLSLYFDIALLRAGPQALPAYPVLLLLALLLMLLVVLLVLTCCCS